MTRTTHLTLALAASLVSLAPGQRLAAQDQRDEWFYLPGSFNW